MYDNWNKNIAYYFDETIGCFNYANGHPMKPIRVAMTDNLLKAYHLDEKLNSFDRDYIEQYIMEVNEKMFTKFHSDEFIDLIKVVTPQNKQLYEDQLYRFNFGEDCPVMDRLYEFCETYTCGSVGIYNLQPQIIDGIFSFKQKAGASLIKDQKVKYSINFSGGLHHAKQSEVSGFCYINDVVLAILELLKVYQRVLYVDIDIHHGDGVEEAFYLTDRVMTCSFHKYKDYFPGTGHLEDVGKNKGLYHAVNFPLSEGMDDENYEFIFKPVISDIMSNFKPEVVVMQCGTDSLSGDRLGCFNLSVKGHGNCARFIKSFNVPMMLLGGGGYTLRNIPRCWTYETSILCETDLANELPEHEFYHYYGPEYKLHLPISNMENTNTKDYLASTMQIIQQNLRKISANGVNITNYKDSQNDIINVDTSEVLSRVKDQQEEQNKDVKGEKMETE